MQNQTLTVANSKPGIYSRLLDSSSAKITPFRPLLDSGHLTYLIFFLNNKHLMKKEEDQGEKKDFDIVISVFEICSHKVMQLST